MQVVRRVQPLALLPALAVLAAAFAMAPQPGYHAATTPRRATAVPGVRLPRYFEPNAGQAAPAVKFVARGQDHTAFLTGSEVLLSLRGSADRASLVRMRLKGASAAPAMRGTDPLPGKVTYLRGRDATRWQSGLPTYRGVRCAAVYPGIDFACYQGDAGEEYDLIVAPHADPNQVRLQFEGAEGVYLDANGNLVLHTPAGEVIHHRPIVYQEVAGKRQAVPARYALSTGAEVRFQLGAYDRSRPLVIDPILSFSTYYGGSGFDDFDGVAADSQGNIYVGGRTGSLNVPLADPIQATYGGDTLDGFVAKIDPSGPTLVYATYLGGNGLDEVAAVGVDASGRATVAGITNSPNFPLQAPVQNVQPGGAFDAFVSRLNAGGTALELSTYLGGSGDDQAADVAVRPTGEAYVAGLTSSPNFPATHQFGTTRGGFDAFVVGFSATGNTVLYSTIVGDGASDVAAGIVVDALGSVRVAGSTGSENFPLQNPSQGAFGGGNSDSFLFRLSPAGDTLLFSTFLGGSGDELGGDMALDANGSVYLAGITQSTDFPVVNAVQGSYGGGTLDAYLAKFPNDNTQAYTTYLGGSGEDTNPHVEINGNLEAFVELQTTSAALPVVDPISGGTAAHGVSDAYIVRLGSDGNPRLFATYLGGAGFDQPSDIALIGDERVVVVGNTTSGDFPTANPLQAEKALSFDGFVSIIAPPPPGAPSNLIGTVISAHRVRLNWNTGGGNPTEFRIERRTGGSEFSLIGTVNSSTTQFEDSNAAPGGEFVYRILAANSNGVSTPSNELTIMVPSGGKLKVTPKKLNFGKVPIGSTRDKTLTIQNIGRGDLAGFVSNAGSPYQVVSNSGAFILIPKAKLTVVVRFTPTSSSTANGTLSVNSTDPAKESVQEKLTGKGK